MGKSRPSVVVGASPYSERGRRELLSEPLLGMRPRPANEAFSWKLCGLGGILGRPFIRIS